MPAKPGGMIDLNILLDVLQRRQPFYESSARLLALLENGQVRGWISALSITTLFYRIRKDRSSAGARGVITNLLQFLRIAPIQQSIIEQVLNLDYHDFKDALQMIAAVQCKLDYLTTRNSQDYQPALLPALSLVEFLIPLQ